MSEEICSAACATEFDMLRHTRGGHIASCPKVGTVRTHLCAGPGCQDGSHRGGITITEEAARNELAAIRLFLGLEDGDSAMGFLRRAFPMGKVGPGPAEYPRVILVRLSRANGLPITIVAPNRYAQYVNQRVRMARYFRMEEVE